MNKRPLALIFGGSRGIGAACVRVLARDGFDVAYTYLSRPTDFGDGTIRAYAADVRDPDSVSAAFSSARHDFGDGPAAIIASAGINVPPAPLAQFSTESFRELVEVNIVGTFNVLQQAARHIVDGGSIVAVSTSLVRHALPGIGPYCASKAAVECLIRSLARELTPRNVRVNAVAPGPVDTDLFRAGKTPEAMQRSAALSPFNRVGKPEEVAETVAFLVSARASWIQAQVVQPNGGLV